MSALKFAMPVVHGRGAGIGNELFVWGKAYLAAEALGLQLMTPAFGINKRQYHRYFETGRLDWLSHRLMRKGLPTYYLTEADFLSEPNRDFSAAVNVFAQTHKLGNKSAFILALDGLWGGVGIIRDARHFLLKQLLNTRFTLANVLQVKRRLSANKLQIGVHIRRGDFAAASEDADYEGKFNQAIPLRWYKAVIDRLAGEFGDAVEFVVATDADKAYIAPLSEHAHIIHTLDQKNSDISDLVLLSDCDLIICSISSYSMCAALLSGVRYVWFAPQLVQSDGLHHIWRPGGADSRRPRDDVAWAEKVRTAPADKARGIASGWDGALPASLFDDLRRRLAAKNQDIDLINGGSVSANF